MIALKKGDAGTATRAVVYTRFSPRPNAAECQSCEVQYAFCEEVCLKKGWTIAAVYNDPDASGADEFRPKLWAAINSLKKGDVLLVYKRDRLARNVYLSEQINRCVAKKGGRIVAATGDVDGDSPEAVMIRQVLASIGEYERKLISMRTRAAMRHYMTEGRRMGGKIPFGWRLDPNDGSRVVEDAGEQAAIAEIVRRRESGQPLHVIAAAMDPSSSRTGRWHPEVVRRILRRTRNADGD